MGNNPIRAAIANGAPSLGTAITVASPVIAEAVTKQGFDWVLIDTQHSSIGWDSLPFVIQGVEVGGGRALVRVGWNDPRLIMLALDLGAIGVIVPMVSTVEDARNAAAAARYPPVGNRSFGPIRQFHSISASNEDVICMVMIETAEGLENVEDIAATPGVDGIFFGPIDLALSLGETPSMLMSDKIAAACDRVIAACERNNIIPGMVSISPEHAEELLARGMRMLIIGIDIANLTTAAKADAEVASGLISRYKR